MRSRFALVAYKIRCVQIQRRGSVEERGRGERDLRKSFYACVGVIEQARKPHRKMNIYVQVNAVEITIILCSVIS
jgi:hypothetical protein